MALAKLIDSPHETIAEKLLAWYGRHHRALPWRVGPRDLAAGRRPDPYRVWLSEVMLQQTTVAAVRPYFLEFLRRWPTVADLAAADQDAVMKAWAGLGYYSRARNLKKCADEVAARYGGRFPDTEAELRALPGIGDYTAAATAAIAFNRPAAVVDGNVERVVARLYAIATPLPQAKKTIREAVQSLVPENRPGDFAQATMDLGATICTPKRPACALCPINRECTAFAGGDPEFYPVKAGKAEKPLRRGAAFVAVNSRGEVLLRKRPEHGLLGGMAEPPTSTWSASGDGGICARDAPFQADWRPAGSIRHIFTHFALDLAVYRADVDMTPPENHWWSGELSAEALPTVMRKAIEATIPGSTRPHPKPGAS